jgi:platelet-activating factor acetylhydrolase
VHQSDFCVLFPGPTRLLFGAREPGRALRLNLRAQLQFLRRCGVAVARTAGAEMVEGPAAAPGSTPPPSTSGSARGEEGGDGDGDGSVDDDPAILEHTHYGRVNHWKWVSVAGR